MTDYGHVAKDTPTWERTNIALQLAHDMMNEMIVCIRHSHHVRDTHERQNTSIFILCIVNILALILWTIICLFMRTFNLI